MTPREIEQYVLLASDATNLQQQQQANLILNQWTSSATTDSSSSSNNKDHAIILLQVLQQTQQEVVLFFALTTFLNLRHASSPDQRAALRQAVLSQLLEHNSSSPCCWHPTYLRTKIGVVLAKFIQWDFPNAWPNAFAELQSPELLQGAPDIVLRTLVALNEEFGKGEDIKDTQLKDWIRGYYDNTAAVKNPSVSPTQTISGRLIQTIISLLQASLASLSNNNGQQSQRSFSSPLQIAVLSLTVLKGFMSWFDLSLLLEETLLSLVFQALALGSTTDSIVGDAAVQAVECLEEVMSRGMESDDKRVQLLIHTNALEQIYQHVNLETVDASPIDVVLEVAKFINLTGLELLPILVQHTNSTLANGGEADNQYDKARMVQSQLFELFMRCYAYDDIDVSGAVIPLAGLLVTCLCGNGGIRNKNGSSTTDEQSMMILSQLLTITFRQMRYPADFQFDYEDEDEAEEEMYRTELRKLLTSKLIRAAPDVCLQFTCQALGELVPQHSLKEAPTSDIEAALRLVYHYCEGIRPPPGMKVVMKNPSFRNLLVALHNSDITHHPHREVLTLYYETAVRYHPLLKEQTELLQIVLEALSGPHGLQHEHPRVRSRCCYLLLRLVKSVGSSSTNKGGSKNSSVLRPYVETAVSGIQGLLESNNTAMQLRTEDTLNLFETIGLLLGKTGLDPIEQQRYLTQVMTPHVRSIEQVLEQQQQMSLQQAPQPGQTLTPDEMFFGEILSGSIAAIAFLSKGFKQPPNEVKMVLLETLKIASAVLEALPNNEQVRNKSFVLLQRLIQCLEHEVLPSMPRLLYLLITHCTTEDILDVAQLLNSLSIKFKADAVQAIDAALLPFLQKCHALIATLDSSVPSPTNGHSQEQTSITAPHQRTEQLSIQKLTYTVLQHIVAQNATALLLSPTNIASFESILQSMSEGAIHVEDPLMKKTCLIFFKDLLNQCSGGGNGATASVAPLPVIVVQGYVRFLYDTLIPGVLSSFLKPTFRVQDANQWRSVSEFAALLEILQHSQHQPKEMYDQEVLVGTVVNRLGCSLVEPSVEAFRTATNRKEIERALKSLIEQVPLSYQTKNGLPPSSPSNGGR